MDIKDESVSAKYGEGSDEQLERSAHDRQGHVLQNPPTQNRNPPGVARFLASQQDGPISYGF